MACANCGKVSGEHFWRAAANEAGWECGWCRTNLGFRPDLDGELLELKVMGLIYDLGSANLIYVSNGTEGELICESVVKRAKKRGRYDQHTLLELILEDPYLGGQSHADYWAKERARALRGDPPVDQRMREIGAPVLPGLEGF